MERMRMREHDDDEFLPVVYKELFEHVQTINRLIIIKHRPRWKLVPVKTITILTNNHHKSHAIFCVYCCLLDFPSCTNTYMHGETWFAFPHKQVFSVLGDSFYSWVDWCMMAAAGTVRQQEQKGQLKTSSSCYSKCYCANTLSLSHVSEE